MHYPADMQPTHARWIYEPESETEVRVEKNNRRHSSDAKPDTKIAPAAQSGSTFASAPLPPLEPFVRNNYAVFDVKYVKETIPRLAPPGRRLMDIPDHALDCLPDECLRDLLEARELEKRALLSWGPETVNGYRAEPEIAYEKETKVGQYQQTYTDMFRNNIRR